MTYQYLTSMPELFAGGDLFLSGLLCPGWPKPRPAVVLLLLPCLLPYDVLPYGVLLLLYDVLLLLLSAPYPLAVARLPYDVEVEEGEELDDDRGCPALLSGESRSTLHMLRSLPRALGVLRGTYSGSLEETGDDSSLSYGPGDPSGELAGGLP